MQEANNNAQHPVKEGSEEQPKLDGGNSSSSSTMTAGAEGREEPGATNNSKTEGTDAEATVVDAAADDGKGAEKQGKDNDNKDNDTQRYIPPYKKPDAALTFPEKMMSLMKFAEKEGDPETYCVAWLPDGKSFIVRNPDDFARKVLPKFFKATKFSSFTRKLYRWGFRQVNRGIGPDDPIIFGNEFFRRDDAELMAKMRSITAASTRKQETDSLQKMLAQKRALDSWEVERDHKRILLAQIMQQQQQHQQLQQLQQQQTQQQQQQQQLQQQQQQQHQQLQQQQLQHHQQQLQQQQQQQHPNFGLNAHALYNSNQLQGLNFATAFNGAGNNQFVNLGGVVMGAGGGGGGNTQFCSSLVGGGGMAPGTHNNNMSAAAAAVVGLKPFDVLAAQHHQGMNMSMNGSGGGGGGVNPLLGSFQLPMSSGATATATNVGGGGGMNNNSNNSSGSNNKNNNTADIVSAAINALRYAP